MSNGGPVFLFFVVLFVVYLIIGIRRTWQRRQYEKRFRSVQLTGIDAMSGTEFESYCVRLLEDQGFRHVEMTPRSNDLGIDIAAKRDGVWYEIQCKRKSANVSRQAVSDVVAALQYCKCSRAMVITNNFFSSGAVTLAESSGCELIDRDELGSWIQHFQGNQRKGS